MLAGTSPGIEADDGGAAPLLVDERVQFGRRQVHPAAAGDLRVGANLTAVHPQQQLRLVQPELAAFVHPA